MSGSTGRRVLIGRRAPIGILSKVEIPPHRHPYAPRFQLRRSEENLVDMQNSSDMKIGFVVGTRQKNIAKVRVETLKFETRVLKYYRARDTYYARDIYNRCILGDFVLIRGIKNPEQQRAPKHVVVDVIDPAPRGLHPLDETFTHSRLNRPAHHGYTRESDL
ncbi:small ribosomal subunit protein uS17m-like [Sycon ciliatum]|uniref:small ribosomal subunit protein uS17m-like n=1 Tax=Sycon ciliatum TaxID=27933 RepID=UPI0020AE9905|eukprot:scpid104786/ scgid12339/ 